MKKDTKDTLIGVSSILSGVSIGVLFGLSLISYDYSLSIDKKDDHQAIISTYENKINYVADSYTFKEIPKNYSSIDLADKIEEEVIVEEEPVIEEVEEIKEVEPERIIVYDNMTIEELSEKINKSLNSTITGKGYLIASHALEVNVDPYIATAIILHETGCKWECSRLVKQCNNVGGQKGSPSCGGGAYKSYPTLDDGIRGCINNLSTNYIALGLNTPELMNKKYAEDPSWASKVNKYVYNIKAK